VPAKTATATTPAKKAPARRAPRKSAPAPLAAELAAGTVRLLWVRKKNGTTRNVPYLAPASATRATAEAIAADRAAGKTVVEISAALHLSVPTVRRALTNLVLAEAIEAGATEADLTAQGYRVVRTSA
jgi:hypothetical protein